MAKILSLPALSLALLVSGAASQACSSIWQKLPSMGAPLGEVSAGIVSIDGADNWCVVGESSGSTQCYDLGAESWSGSAPKRDCTGNHHCTVNTGSKMYLLGGLGGCDTRFQVFNGESWSELPALPFASGSGSCGFRDGKIWLCGGLHGTVSKGQCASYDLSTEDWTVSGSQEVSVNHAAYCIAGKHLYMYAGRTGRNVVGTAIDTCQKFDTVSGTTSSCKDVPYPIGGTGNCINSLGGRWLFGGELDHAQFAEYEPEFGGNAGGDGGTLSAVSFFDWRTQQWSHKINMPEGKHGIFPVVHDGFVYIAGGSSSAGFGQSTTAFRADLAKLKECGA